MAIPDFRDDGHLPIGLHAAAEEEVRQRFGVANARRMELMSRVSSWLHLARMVKAQRFLVNGSFVTAKAEPNDVDCTCWLPRDFEEQYNWGSYEAVRLQDSIYSGRPQELFAALNETQWEYWVDFFSRIRDRKNVLKGIVEITL